ncbi:MAG: hypothetical protein MUE54_02150 [Anaerolineae bacterium]|nr:hypothetical protein [Anaerolineae bacterium]
MSYNSKQNTTIFIWIATTIISIFSLMSEGWVVSIPLGVALFATVAIWTSGNESEAKNQKNQTSSSSSSTEKRGDSTAYTMALLMEMMDEDEREEFKSQLKRRILSGDK